VNTKHTNQQDVEKTRLDQAFFFCFIIVILYEVLSSVKMRKKYAMLHEIDRRSAPLHEEPSKRRYQPPLNETLPDVSSGIDQPFLIESGIIQVILVVMAAAFTIRAFTVSSDSQAFLILGASFFVPTIHIAELANWVFMISGTISTALYAIYLWEWTDRNIRISATHTRRVWMSVLALVVHLSFLFLLAAILILQVLTRNIMPS